MKILALLLCFLQLNIFSFTTKTPQEVVSLKNETVIVNSLAEEVGSKVEIEQTDKSALDFDIFRRFTNSYSKYRIEGFDVDNNGIILVFTTSGSADYEICFFDTNCKFVYGFKTSWKGGFHVEFGKNGILIYFSDYLVEYDYNLIPLRCFKILGGYYRYSYDNELSLNNDTYFTVGNEFNIKTVLKKKNLSGDEIVIYDGGNILQWEILIAFIVLLIAYSIVLIWIITACKKNKVKNNANQN